MPAWMTWVVENHASARRKLGGFHMLYLRIPATGFLPDRAMFLDQDRRGTISSSQLAGNRQPDHAGTNDLNRSSVSISFRNKARFRHAYSMSEVGTARKSR
jgi:hypothetical protein